MKKYIHIPVLLILASLLMVSCDGFLDAGSERYTFEEEYGVNSDHDSLYSMTGIFYNLQKLGDRYVLLGELRGDLMQTEDDASKFLKQINEFTVTKDNPYASTKEYYAVINNCNYTIKNVDTSKVYNGYDKKMYRLMASAKSIRAWTYLQLALNYGSVNYIEDPILSAEDAEKEYQKLDINALADVLIEDLLPFKDIQTLNPGSFASFDTKLSIFPLKFLLGDLYLLKNDYKNAAKMYHELMYDKEAIIDEYYMNEVTFVNNAESGAGYIWQNVFKPSSTEVISAIASSPDYGNPFNLDSLSYNFMIGPTQYIINKWENAIYYKTDLQLTTSDRRGVCSYNSLINKHKSITASMFSYVDPKKPIIAKYLGYNTEEEKRIVLYRNSLLYLRYAEAINRLGYPETAYAILTTGLNQTTVRKSKIANEIGTTGGNAAPEYLDFSDYRFTSNVGTMMRGLGNTNIDSTYYNLKPQANKPDSILFVENAIVDELAAELAFEGNRFHDLMRIAKRRNDPAFLADKVSRKYANKEIVRSKLMDIKNWYLPN
jgi:hypothetical protein